MNLLQKENLSIRLIIQLRFNPTQPAGDPSQPADILDTAWKSINRSKKPVLSFWQLLKKSFKKESSLIMEMKDPGQDGLENATKNA